MLNRICTGYLKTFPSGFSHEKVVEHAISCSFVFYNQLTSVFHFLGFERADCILMYRSLDHYRQKDNIFLLNTQCSLLLYVRYSQILIMIK